jgi:hypothetical protein
VKKADFRKKVKLSKKSKGEKMTVYKLSENADWQPIDEGCVILNLETGLYCKVNELGTKIISLCDGKATLEQIIEKICEEFDVTKEEANKDANNFLGELKNKNLIQEIGV